MKIHVGCCGLPVGLKKYAKIFDCVEINKTFYKLPKLETAKKWRNVTPKNFIFCVKCFQGVTHPTSSPTWRRYGEIEGKKENYGNFQDTEEVRDSWKRTYEFCKALGARICLIQTPKRFKDTEENVKNVEKFFRKIERKDLEIAIEFRGWDEKNIKKICKKFKLIEAVDPFSKMPSILTKTIYFRLHGSPPGKKMYSYKYTANDLKILLEKIRSLKKPVKEVFVFFNNVYMKDDASNFKKLVERYL